MVHHVRIYGNMYSSIRHRQMDGNMYSSIRHRQMDGNMYSSIRHRRMDKRQHQQAPVHSGLAHFGSPVVAPPMANAAACSATLATSSYTSSGPSSMGGGGGLKVGMPGGGARLGGNPLGTPGDPLCGFILRSGTLGCSRGLKAGRGARL